jgi:glycerate 2-kinase
VPPGHRDVYRSSTRGTGELLLAARDLGADSILLGVGGSATSDLGLGALSALGWRFEAAAGALLAPPVPASWPELARVLRGAPLELPPLRIACDVDNPVLGPRGAAAVYGPQKGLAAQAVGAFDAAAARVASIACAGLGVGRELLSVPGAGAAGGTAFGLLAGAGARLVPGSALVGAWLGLEARVAAADWVLTGEGRFDESSWAGKGPGALVRAAQRHGRRWAVFAGSIALGEGARRGAELEGGVLVAITARGEPVTRALPHTAESLARSVRAWLGELELAAAGGPQSPRPKSSH